MKIIVLMKQVANKDAILRINKNETWIEEGDLSYEVNESDGYALEEALRLKEKHGGEVVVCTMGPQRAKAVIKDALARGAERAIHPAAADTARLAPAPRARGGRGARRPSSRTRRPAGPTARSTSSPTTPWAWGRTKRHRFWQR